jgi:hypothetical protein
MTGDLFGQLATALLAGVGLLAVGGVNLLLRRKPAAVRGLLTAAAAGLTLAGVWAATGEPRSVRAVGVVLAAGVGACLVVGSDRVAAVLGFARRPGVAWAALALVGFAAALGSVAWYDLSMKASGDRDAADLDLFTGSPPDTTPIPTLARTDRGTPVLLKEATTLRSGVDLGAVEQVVIRDAFTRSTVIRVQPADDRANCHGFVFAGGRFWIGGSSVDQILDENGYRPVTDPRPGDVAVYRGSGGAVAHTAVVRYVTAGQPVLVEGKWGCVGVFLHAVDQSIYGTAYGFYRSTRPGHLLAGLDGSPDPVPASPPPAENTRAVVPALADPDAFTE